jgi:hypothetical protein
MTAIIKLLPTIRKQASLNDQEFNQLAVKTTEILSNITKPDVIRLYEAYKKNKLTLNDVLEIFNFATSLYNVNITNDKLGIGLARITLLLRQLVALNQLAMTRPNTEFQLSKLLYNFPDLNPREIHPAMGEHQDLTLKNYIKLNTPNTSPRTQLLNMTFPRLRVGQILNHEDLMAWNQVTEKLKAAQQ